MSDDFVIPGGDGDKGTTAYVNPKVDDCPVIPLGHEGRDVIFALPEGSIRREPAGRIAQMLRTDIYASVAGSIFLGNWRDDEGKIQLQEAAKWLVRECRDRGVWDADRPQRGYGVWAGDNGPMVHVGDAIGEWPLGSENWRPVSEALREDVSGPLWLLRPKMARPSKAATIKQAQNIRAVLNLWSFSPLDPRAPEGLSQADALFGWLGVQLLGAWPRFRPVVNVSGGAGTGKTTLSRLMQAAGSANAGDLLDTFTDAGLKNTLSSEARGLFLDEAEPSTDGQAGPVERALEVIRRMATGEGSSGRKGSINGGAVATSAVGCAYLASIFPVPLGDAMATRTLEIRMGRLDGRKGTTDDDLEATIEAARALSPALLARALRDAKRFRADVAAIKAALVESKQAHRAADLIASLAAGRRLLLYDTALTEAEAKAEAETWLGLAQARAERSSSQNPGQGCLQYIWAINSGHLGHDRALTIGELVQEELEQAGGRASRVLKAWGLIIENGHAGTDRPGPWLLVANNHPALEKALRGTEFANWRGVLEHLADLGPSVAPRPGDGPKRFGMHQSRVLCVPLTPWLDKPVAVGVDPREPTPFEPPRWSRSGSASHDSSHSASHGETHD
ncbi:MAG: hypothetical protein ACK4M2_01640 [Brevundimonas sp.]